jgi:hypothetical protein
VQLTSKIYSFPINFGAASLAAGATWEFQLSFHLNDWATTFNPVDDWYHTGYALGSLPAAYVATNYIPVYVNGSLAAGSEPGMGPTNTPGPSNTVTKTPTIGITATPTLTPVRTNTPTLTPVVATLTPTKTLTPLPITLTPTKTLTPVITLTPTRTLTVGITNTPTRTSTAGPTSTRTVTPVISLTPTRTSTVTVVIPDPTITPTLGCSPVTSTITAPFTYDGAGAFCWQSSNLGTYINSWNTTSVTVNGTNFTNLYVAAGSLPAKLNGYWYVTYNSAVSYGHFEAK